MASMLPESTNNRINKYILYFDEQQVEVGNANHYLQRNFSKAWLKRENFAPSYNLRHTFLN